MSRATLHRVRLSRAIKDLYRISLYCVFIRANQMWMPHHCSLHIESRPCWGPSHTRARRYTSLASIRHASTTWQIFVTPRPKMGRSPRDTQLCTCSKFWCAFFERSLQSLMTVLKPKWNHIINIASQICQMSHVPQNATNLVWSIGILSPNCTMVGPIITLSSLDIMFGPCNPAGVSLPVLTLDDPRG